ncbi:hypothetical protein G6F43_000229 [Rhizopus delemar]|nr:hypothetical protein G6F43_000229 [Rhizopus delemar]
MNQLDDLVIASQFAEQEQQQNRLREGQVQHINPASSEIVIGQTSVQDNIDAAISGEIKEEEYESSDLEFSSDDDDSSSEEKEEDTKEGNIVEEEEEEEEGAPSQGGVVKTANEITDFTVEKPVFDLTQQTEILYAGNIFQIIQNVVVVHSRPGSEYNALDAGSLLVYENREVMGEIFETFGPISRPYYTVRFNDESEINNEWTTVGAAVYYVPSYQKTQIIQTERLRMIKHTDASNFYDEEIGEDEMEFSDDEKELAYRQQKNKEKRMRKKDTKRETTAGNRFNKKPKTTPADFDAALEAYEGSTPQLPPRQQQSYADIL